VEEGDVVAGDVLDGLDGPGAREAAGGEVTRGAPIGGSARSSLETIAKRVPEVSVNASRISTTSDRRETARRAIGFHRPGAAPIEHREADHAACAWTTCDGVFYGTDAAPSMERDDV
jgi:hypothetical protein